MVQLNLYKYLYGEMNQVFGVGYGMKAWELANDANNMCVNFNNNAMIRQRRRFKVRVLFQVNPSPKRYLLVYLKTPLSVPGNMQNVLFFMPDVISKLSVKSCLEVWYSECTWFGYLLIRVRKRLADLFARYVMVNEMYMLSCSICDTKYERNIPDYRTSSGSIMYKTRNGFIVFVRTFLLCWVLNFLEFTNQRLAVLLVCKLRWLDSFLIVA